MKPLKPTGRIDLEHRAYHLSGSPSGSVIVAAAEEGDKVSLIDLAKHKVQIHRQSAKVKAVSPHPSEPLFAFVDGLTGSLEIQSFAGKRLAQFKPTCNKETASDSATSWFADCHFDESGDALWLASALSAYECELLLLKSDGWSVVHTSAVVDRFRGSTYSFHPTGRPGLLSFWIAAGQDGQEVYWLERSGFGFSLENAEELANCIPPVFSPDGSEYLVINEQDTICRYSFGMRKRVGSLMPPADEDASFGTSLCYLDHRHAIAGTGEGRIFLVDTVKMKIEDEVTIQGHEPRPIGHYYPALAHEGGLATDISWFTRLGNVIVFVFRRDRGTGSELWQDSLLWYLVKDWRSS